MEQAAKAIAALHLAVRGWSHIGRSAGRPLPVELGQPHGIHHEEVNRQDQIGVLANEFAPGALAAARRWR